MADTLKRLSGPTALTTSAVTQYTTPGGTTTTIRNLHVCNESGSDATFTLSIGTDGAGKRLYKDVTVPVNDSFDAGLSVVLAATEIVQAFASAGSALTLTISGVEST